MLELHIWGPSFGLPSIDAQCIATIAYLGLTLPKDQWTVVASSNPLLSPSRELPALRDDRTWATGFRGIVEYVCKKTDGQSDLDSFLSSIEKAECTAFSAHLETHGQPLIDLSLYVSRKNFDSCTRSIYATLLPFPMQYYMPVLLRSQAKDRTAGLGVTALELDAVESTPKAPEAGVPHTTAPPEQKPTSMLSSTEVVATFKLMDLVADFLEPLQARLGDEKHFFGDYPSSLDCLAVGYLSVCFFPELPQAWLANEMKKRFPRMCGYLNDMRPQLLGEFVDAKLILSHTYGGEKIAHMIPWGVAERGDLPWMSRFLFEKALEAMGWGRNNELRMQKDKEKEAAMDPMDLERKKKAEAAKRKQQIRSVLTVAGGIAAFVGYCVWMLQAGSQFETEVVAGHGDEDGEEHVIVGEGDEEEGDEEEGDEEEEDEEEEEEEDEETRRAREAEEIETIERIKGDSDQNPFGLAGAILGIRNPVPPQEPSAQEFSPQEEEEIAKDIHKEEEEVDEAIAKDVEEDLERKSK